MVSAVLALDALNTARLFVGGYFTGIRRSRFAPIRENTSYKSQASASTKADRTAKPNAIREKVSGSSLVRVVARR